jgi:Protein of unknown function (DUF732)
MAAARTAPRAVLAAVAVTIVLAGCGSSDPARTNGLPSPAVPINSVAAPTTSGFNDLDPADTAFVGQLLAEGLAPNPNDFSDAVFVTDANAICRILAVPGEAAEITQADLLNMRSTRADAYGITEQQANQVMVLSAQTYCPAQVATVKRALG